MKIITFIFISLFFIQTGSLAHGDLHKRIQEISYQIEEHPDSLYLYLKRGILYFQHEDFNNSLKDLKICEAKKYKDKLLDLTIAKVHHKLGDYNNALNYVNKILVVDQNYVHAWKLKGRVCFDLKEYQNAAESFEEVINRAFGRLPSNYLDASLANELTGNEKGIKAAIDILYKGIEDLGSLITFHERLVKLGLLLNDYEMALLHQTKIIELSKRKETSLYKRSLIYSQRGDDNHALSDLNDALDAFNDLPQRYQSTKAMKSLHTQIQLQLEKSRQNSKK